MPFTRLLSLLLFLLLCAVGAGARAGDTYTFAGNGVNGCTLSGKTYTCPALPLPNGDDRVVIGNGYTVTANGDVNFGYNQGLAISGGGTLKISGNLDIGNIQPSLLQVNGATLIAGKTFSIGAQAQTIVADIKAASMNLGTGSPTKITGTVTSTGPVNIASYTTIVGPVSGTAIVTNSPVTLTGDVTATTSLFLASYATVKGNIVSPTVTTGAPVTVTGNVTATQRFQLASGSSVTGNVVAGELTLDNSEAIINGNATVTHATLEWHGRVTETITCTGGTTPGQCDCVTNNSGYDIRKNAKSNANGPYCEGKAQPAPVLDHFVIAHPAAASVCGPATVTVTACANAACSATYASGTAVFLQPSNQRVDIGASGTASAGLALQPADKVVLSLLKDGARPPMSCTLSNGTASDCSIKVSKAALVLSLNEKNAFVAAEAAAAMPPLKISAQVYDGTKAACVPLFKSVTQTVNLSFDYANPAKGAVKPLIAKNAFSPKTAYPVALAFDETGNAQTSLSYDDAGKLSIAATYKGQDIEVSGSLDVVAAPASFKVEATLAAPYFAGKPFTAKVSAMNRKNQATPNFGKEQQPIHVGLSGKLCLPAQGKTGFVAPLAPTSNDGGVQTFVPTAETPVPRMDEVGKIDLLASLAADYLDSGLTPTGSTSDGLAACAGALGPFIPAYFELTEDGAWTRTTLQGGAQRKQYYSGEPGIALTLTARNQQKGATENYAKDKLARDVDLIAIDANAVPASALATTVGALNTLKSCLSKESHLVCAEDFTAGIATWSQGSFAFKARKTAPLSARLRASDSTGASSSYASTEPLIVVRSGRVRLSNVFGTAKAPLYMPVNLEYWDGGAWVRNFDDGTTTFLDSAVAVPVGAGITPKMETVAGGLGRLKLTPKAGLGTASIPVALNLRSGVNDDACNTVTPKPGTSGAGRAYLRSTDANCADTAPHDPWARASFGVYSDETRRIIHVREVFR